MNFHYEVFIGTIEQYIEETVDANDWRVIENFVMFYSDDVFIFAVQVKNVLSIKKVYDE